MTQQMGRDIVTPHEKDMETIEIHNKWINLLQEVDKEFEEKAALKKD